MRSLARLAALAAVLALASPAFAQEPKKDAAPNPPAPTVYPVKVALGIYLLRIDQLDLKAGSATVTFYTWARWQGADVDGSAYEVMNGHLEAKDNEHRYEKDGLIYAYHRCRATVNLDVDYRRFPFDEHRLSIELEHAKEDTAKVLFEVDQESMKFLEAPKRAGWLVGAPTYEVTKTLYRTSWGMIGARADETSESTRLRATVTLRHSAGSTFTKTFLLLFVSMLITFLAFFMHPEELEARIGVGVAATFGAVTSNSVVSENLPEVSYMTLSDKIHTASLFFVFATLLATSYVAHLARQDQVDRAKRVGRKLGFLTAVAYVALVLGLLRWS